ncbi:glutaminase A [Spelaeicoccus albus]|uniref:Glutaminase n=1 Tax=Spelaeicoccus albus TaxID=1280376 RepID=A0A7Z0D5G7_9MICO|nr:glutaminase A [Spelaeicoccus albus]NYI69203.1 glutaminase [Spelaeicoccus albus]
MESPLDSYLRALHADIASLTGGTPYSAGPGTPDPDPSQFGICLATADGYVYQVGDTASEFSIQSISKPFTYGLALADLGMDAVDEKVDVEPSGDPFNEVSLTKSSGRPPNAMVNAGALAATGLIKGSGGKSAIKRIVRTYSEFAGRHLTIDKHAVDAEIKISDRNHAFAYLLSSYGIIEGDPTAVLKNYLRQCSVQVTCRDLSIMAATLANGGTNPVTGVQAMDIGPVERVLSVMMTSGMYDDAGSWVASVGMPAKSGVGGGIIAVLPGEVGLAVYSPPLDHHGNSVRGVAVSERLSHDMEMHFVRSARPGRSAIRASYDITHAPSGIRRTDEGAALLLEFGNRAQVIELTGDLIFAGTESMVREVSGLDSSVEFVVLDVRRVDDVGAVALTMFQRLAASLADEHRELLLIDGEGSLADALNNSGHAVPTFRTRTAAVEHCEDRLLAIHGAGLNLPATVSVAASPALSPMDPADIAELAKLMERRRYDDGEIVRRVGQRFGGIFFIVSGQILTLTTGPDGKRIRLSTLSAGMTFGELALGSEDRQETTEKADGPVELMVLEADNLAKLEDENPRLATELWKALTRDAYTRVDQYLRETAVRIRD